MTSRLEPLETLLAEQRRLQRTRLGTAALAAVGGAAATVCLLGLSGWFITGAALAGLAGAAAAHSFNVLLPGAAIRLLAILRTASRYVERLSGHEAALKALAALRPALFAGLAAGPPERAFALASGEASARLGQDVDAIQTLFVRRSGPWGAGAGAAAAVVLVSLSGLGPALALVLGLAGSVLGALVIGRACTDAAGRDIQRAMGRLKDRLSSLEACAPELRAYGLEDWAIHQVAASAGLLDLATARAGRGSGWIAAWQVFTMGVTVVAVVALSPSQPAPMVALAALATVASIEAAAALTSHFRSSGAAHEAMTRLADVLTSGARVAAEHPLTGQDTPLGFGPSEPHFAWPSRIAIVGRTGSGKTTLVERLMGLRPDPSASLHIGGRSPRQSTDASVRQLFAYSSQDMRFLSGTVRTNLAVADPGADEPAMWSVLEDAGLAARIRTSASGLDMPLGDNGSALSGGERRRLGLARAYLRPTPWLVLDEPTEGLDAIQEKQVLLALSERLSRTGQGLLLISHRPAPIGLCDTVLTVSGMGPQGDIALSSSGRLCQAA